LAGNSEITIKLRPLAPGRYRGLPRQAIGAPVQFIRAAFTHSIEMTFPLRT
jgi:hypothetical protein